ncbi:MAG: CoA-binding domain protein [Parcubacteria group bacterium GW2011_GWC2_38_7]|nr:MAG: CoA-binding domain protein [Parcubacteria group bacterium GW2011_GWC2_38_7]
MIDLREIKTIAVVGASNNSEKVGFQIVKNLKQRNYKVFPINLKEKEIQTLKVYPDLSSLPERPDLVDIVVPPPVTLEVVKEALNLDIKNIWIQPGAESEEVIRLLKQHPEVNVVSQSCIMMN